MNDDSYDKLTKLGYCRKCYMCVNSGEAYVNMEGNLPKFQETN